MAWSGDVRWHAALAGPKSGTVRLGDYLVPRFVTMTGDGHAGDPDLRLEFTVDTDEQARCVEVTVTAKPGGRGLRSSDLGLFQLDTITAAAFERFAEPIIDEGPGTMTTVKLAQLGEADLWRLRREIDSAMHERGRGASDAELVEVARVYLAHPTAPLKALEATFGYTRRTAARRAKEARERGYMENPELPVKPPVPEFTQEEILSILRGIGPRDESPLPDEEEGGRDDG